MKKQAAVYAYSPKGREKAALTEAFLLDRGYELQNAEKRELDQECWQRLSVIVFIGACGIAVRKIAPWVWDKRSDPAVLVLDEQGKYCISLLSGHAGGANELCKKLSEHLGAEPVITTATDLAEKFAVDVFARQNDLILTDWQLAKEVSAALIREEKVGFASELPPVLLQADHDYAGLQMGQEAENCALGIWVGNRQTAPFEKTLFLRPKNLVLGIGCRSGKSAADLKAFAEEALRQAGFFREQVCLVCSIDQKKEEAGLLEFCRMLSVPFQVFSAAELEAAKGSFAESAFVKEQMGVGNVCERSAVLGSGQGRLLLPKWAKDGMTLAVAERRAVCAAE